jgi:uncharacterized membrane protein
MRTKKRQNAKDVGLKLGRRGVMPSASVKKLTEHHRTIRSRVHNQRAENKTLKSHNVKIAPSPAIAHTAQRVLKTRDPAFFGFPILHFFLRLLLYFVFLRLCLLPLTYLSLVSIFH